MEDEVLLTAIWCGEEADRIAERVSNQFRGLLLNESEKEKVGDAIFAVIGSAALRRSKSQ